jgi:hypothetical protein
MLITDENFDWEANNVESKTSTDLDGLFFSAGLCSALRMRIV